jgi:hypothetical protein
LADDHTPKERVLRPNDEGGAHSDRWTRAASTRPHIYRQRELHRERLRHAGAPEVEHMSPPGARAENTGAERSQHAGGRQVPESREYGQKPPSAGVSATGSGPEDTTP